MLAISGRRTSRPLWGVDLKYWDRERFRTARTVRFRSLCECSTQISRLAKTFCGPAIA